MDTGDTNSYCHRLLIFIIILLLVVGVYCIIVC